MYAVQPACHPCSVRRNNPDEHRRALDLTRTQIEGEDTLVFNVLENIRPMIVMTR
jgi:hypothetical protein